MSGKEGVMRGRSARKREKPEGAVSVRLEVPRELHWQLKLQAMLAQVTLTEWVMEALRQSVETGEPDEDGEEGRREEGAPASN